MSSLRGRIVYWLLKVQRPPFDPAKSVQQQRALLENQVRCASVVTTGNGGHANLEERPCSN